MVGPVAGGDGGRTRHQAADRAEDVFGTADLAALELEGLERRICAGAAELAAAQCAWLLAVAEYDRREGWRRWGCRSLTHWLSWKCGLSPSTARAQVTVARALAHWPATRQAFAAGRLSYSKVRAIVRAGDPALDDVLATWAQTASAAQLERIVGDWRRTRRLTAPTPPDVPEQQLDWWWDDDGYLQIRGRFRPENGAVLIASWQAALDALDRDDQHGTGLPHHPPTDPQPDPWGAAAAARATERRADAAIVAATSVLDHGTTSRSPAELFDLVIHADADTLTDPDPTDDDGTSASAEAPHPDLEQVRQRLRRGVAPSGRGHLATGPALSPRTLRRLACTTRVIGLIEDHGGQPLDIGRASPKVPTGMRRALYARDHHTCRYPGCGRRRQLEAHHVWHWAAGGPTRIDNLILLCSHHHDTIHHGHVDLLTDGPGRYRFIRRADRHHLTDTDPPHPTDPTHLIAANRARHVDPPPNALQPHTYGPYDRHLATSILHDTHQHAHHTHPN